MFGRGLVDRVTVVATVSIPISMRGSEQNGFVSHRRGRGLVSLDREGVPLVGFRRRVEDGGGTGPVISEGQISG